MAHGREASAQKCGGRSDPDNRTKWRSSKGWISGARGQASMILLLALQLVAGSAQVPVSPAQHYENAKQDFAQRNFTEADREVNLALRESPYMVPALVLKARLAAFARRSDVEKRCLI